jgi:hypothetical protein
MSGAVLRIQFYVDPDTDLDPRIHASGYVPPDSDPDPQHWSGGSEGLADRDFGFSCMSEY